MNEVLNLPGVSVEAVQKRTVRTLVVSQAVGSVGITFGIATASLLATEISGSEAQAGLAQTCQVAGTAAAAYGLARVMGRRGRRVGLLAGYLIGATGSLLAVVAGVVESMAVLLVGAAMLGATAAVNQASRYAATDLAEDEHRARTLSVVVWATTIGAVAGPNLTGAGAAVARATGLPLLTGSFALGAVVLVCTACWLAVRLRPDPLLLARQRAAVNPVVAVPGGSWSRLVATLRATPAVGAAIAGMACAHAAMVAVMVMTPLHMDHGGAHLDVIGVVISVHVLGMFAFSPLVGMVADRVGRGNVLAGGGAFLVLATALCGAAPAGNSWQIWAGLFLLGLGWSGTTVAGSTLVAELTPVEARTDVQGAGDMTMSLVAAGGGGLSGAIVAGAGFAALAGFSALLAGVAVVAGLVTRNAP